MTFRFGVSVSHDVNIDGFDETRSVIFNIDDETALSFRRTTELEAFNFQAFEDKHGLSISCLAADCKPVT